ncbi:hypothetical protein N8J89_16940 [Crossiella sp. CA-258035]|uniref:hypothetical protein n=1 Tax=Crossiella sp. CA-258035 TaxID=2981138 RepID=UPI0024BD0522|nr:hypothetical protein [Crossiella sp. CA-258035]WHT22684.1 hypothetical protein N8J89_16940 [Crossiella sp. CA-258035]
MTALAVVSVVQSLLAVTFWLVPIAGARRGTAAQRAAEAEVVRQGFLASVLAGRGIDFSASAASLVLAASIGLAFAALGALNLAGADLGRTLSWVAQPVILVLGLIVMPGEIWTTRYVEAGFRKSGDPAVRGLDVGSMVEAARRAYPAWLPLAVVARFALATAGSVLVMVLLLV